MKKSYLLFAILILFSQEVLGFGLSSDYLQNNILLLAPGANYEYRINIQNPLPVPMFVNLALDDNNGIAKFNTTNHVFEIPATSYNTQIPLFIQIPWHTSEGKTYDISYRAEPVDGANGGIGFGISLSRSFSVKISKDGFIARGLHTEKKEFSGITANIIKTVYVNKLQIGSTFLVLIAIIIITSLLWKRSEIISNNILSKKTRKTNNAYSTLEEFYDLMSNADNKTFLNYTALYEKDLRAWLAKTRSPEFAKRVMSSTTQREFLQRLKNELQKN